MDPTTSSQHGPNPTAFQMERPTLTLVSGLWVRGGGSRLDKRQCTVQITLFADGERRVKPLIIFRGKGKRIPFTEPVKYDRRVMARFQPNAWCDEDIMPFWIKDCWKPSCSGPVQDIHRAQKRSKTCLRQNATPTSLMYQVVVHLLFSQLMYHSTSTSKVQ